MNEVGRAIVDIVIVALVAQALPVVYIVAQFGKVLHGLDVMRLKSLVTAAYLASVPTSFKHGLTPSQIVGATPTLGIPRIATLSYTLAFHTAIGVLIGFVQSAVYHIRVRPSESLATNLADTKRRVGKRMAAQGAIDSPPNVRRRPLQLFAAMLTGNGHFLRLGLRRTLTRAISLLGILRPTAVGFFGDDCPTGCAGL